MEGSKASKAGGEPSSTSGEVRRWRGRAWHHMTRCRPKFRFKAARCHAFPPPSPPPDHPHTSHCCHRRSSLYDVAVSLSVTAEPSDLISQTFQYPYYLQQFSPPSSVIFDTATKPVTRLVTSSPSRTHFQLLSNRTVSQKQPWHPAAMAPMKPNNNNNRSSSNYGEGIARQANILASAYLVDPSASALKGLHYCTTGVAGAEWYS